jgi:hypothetical protein
MIAYKKIGLLVSLLGLAILISAPLFGFFLLFLGFNFDFDKVQILVEIGILLFVIGFMGVLKQRFIKINTPAFIFEADRQINATQIKSGFLNQVAYNCYICKRPLSQTKNVYLIEDCVMEHYFCEDCSKEWSINYKNLMNNYLFGNLGNVKEMFNVPRVSINSSKFKKVYVGELAFTSKGVCFINTGYYEHYYDSPEPMSFILFIPNFFCSVLIGTFIINFFNLSLKAMGVPIVAMVFMSLYKIEESFWKNKIQETKDRVWDEKINTLGLCKNFRSKVSAARDVYFFELEEILGISGNKNKLAIEIKQGPQTSVFRIELGAFEDYRTQIETYLRTRASAASG